jgi:hypothetical protein
MAHQAEISPEMEFNVAKNGCVLEVLQIKD